MTVFQRLVLRALGAILYCLVWKDKTVFLRQGDEARKKLIEELRDAASSCVVDEREGEK